MIVANQITDKTFSHVYYVTSEKVDKASQASDLVNPIAIRLKIFSGRAEWEDTGRGKSVVIKEIKIGDPIVLTSDKGIKYTFVFLTLQVFNRSLKDKIVAFKDRIFKNDDELQKYYLQTDFEPYGI